MTDTSNERMAEIESENVELSVHRGAQKVSDLLAKVAELRGGRYCQGVERHYQDRIAELEVENATLKLTGNENAVNCDRHGEPIAYLPENGSCPACQNEESIGEERQVLCKRIAELKSDNLKLSIMNWIKENPGADDKDVAVEFELSGKDAGDFVDELLNEGRIAFDE